MTKQPTLDGKVSILFGAGAIASGYVPLFAEEGMNLVIVGIDGTGKALEEKTTAKDGRKVVGMEADASDYAKVGEVFARAAEEFGRIDVVVNGAGGNKKEATAGSLDEFADMDPEVAQKMMGSNFFSKRWALQHFLRYLRGADHQGRVVNITSMSGLDPLSRIPDYSTAYAAIENLTRSMAFLYGRYGVGAVNNVAVGFTIGEQNRDLLLNKQGGLTPRGKEIIDNTAIGRFLETKEIGPYVVFLADPAKSAELTGVTLRVDGGFGLVSLAGTSGYCDVSGTREG